MPAAAWVLVVVTGLLISTFHTQEKSVVILLPDADGTVGQVAVATQGGEQLLAAANQMTVVSSQTKSPSSPTVASTEYIERNFAEALALQPSTPAKFILYFQPDSTDLDPESTALIPRILAAIILRESKDIGIHGHADRVGAQEQNLELSLRRALTVKEILHQQGILEEFLEVTSHGEGNPLVPTPDDVAEPRNRRVEVVVR